MPYGVGGFWLRWGRAVRRIPGRCPSQLCRVDPHLVVWPTMLLPTPAGVFFVYDMSPFMVEVIPGTRPPFSHLLTRLCAVAGGALAVSGMLNFALFYMADRLGPKGVLAR